MEHRFNDTDAIDSQSLGPVAKHLFSEAHSSDYLSPLIAKLAIATPVGSAEGLFIPPLAVLKDSSAENSQARSLGKPITEVEKFREKLRSSGIDPDDLAFKIGIYEPDNDFDKERVHAAQVTAMISDSKIGISRRAATNLVTDREIAVSADDYLTKEHGLSAFISAYGAAGMNSLTRALQKHCIDKSDDKMRVFNVSQGYSSIDCLRETVRLFEKNPSKYATFVNDLLGEEKGKEWINQHEKLNVALEKQRMQHRSGETPTPITERPDRRLHCELMQKFHDKIHSELASSQDFQKAFQKYRDTTKVVADKGINIVVAAANDGYFDKAHKIHTPNGAQYNWYAMSDHVIAVGAADIGQKLNDRSDDSVWHCSSRGTERWHPTVLAQGCDVPSFKYPDEAVHGTSFAAPQVAATIALMLQQNPALKFQEVRRILAQSCHRLPDVSVQAQGAGVLEVDRAVIMARKSP